jgi:hypothetical protein
MLTWRMRQLGYIQETNSITYVYTGVPGELPVNPAGMRLSRDAAAADPCI